MFLLFTDYFPIIMSLKTQHKQLIVFFQFFMFVWLTEFYSLDLNNFKDMCIINDSPIKFFYFNFISILEAEAIWNLTVTFFLKSIFDLLTLNRFPNSFLHCTHGRQKKFTIFSSTLPTP